MDPIAHSDIRTAHSWIGIFGNHGNAWSARNDGQKILDQLLKCWRKRRFRNSRMSAPQVSYAARIAHQMVQRCHFVCLWKRDNYLCIYVITPLRD